MSYEQILYAVEHEVLTITLNRPDRLNAFTGVMMGELIDAFDRADADDAVRAIIVTGAGRGFCAGADLGRGADSFAGESGGMAAGEGGGRLGVAWWLRRTDACRLRGVVRSVAARGHREWA